MGMKYMLYAFNYPKSIGYEEEKQTRYLIVCIFWFIILSVLYDGVTVEKRGE